MFFQGWMGLAIKPVQNQRTNKQRLVVSFHPATLRLAAMSRALTFCLALVLAWQLGADCRSSPPFREMWADHSGCLRGALSSESARGAAKRVPEVSDPGGGRRVRRAMANTDPKIITRRFNTAASASDVLDIMQSEKENPELNLISVTAAWTRLAQLQRSINTEMTEPSPFLLFVNVTLSLLEQPAGLSRSVANLLWAAARLQGRAASQLAPLWTSLAHATNATASKMNEQELANSIWAVAKLAKPGSSSKDLLSTLPSLARRAPAVTPIMTAQAVSNVLWAMGKTKSKALFGLWPALIARLPGVITDMTTQEVANVMWATGQLSSVDTSNTAMLQ